MAYLDFESTNGIFRVHYSETTNQSANTSTITITKCQFASTNWYGTNFQGDGVVQVNGVTVVTLTNDNNHATGYIGSTYEFHDIGGSSASQSVTISHNADGTGAFAITLKGRPGVYNDMNMFCIVSPKGNYAYNGTQYADLTPISRQFTLSISEGFNTTITVNRTSSPLGNGSTGNLSNGATIYYNDILIISFGVPTGCVLSTHTVNGSAFTSGNPHTVTSDVSVKASATVNSYTLSLTIGSYVTVAVNRTSSPLQGAAEGYLSNGATIYYGDALNITYTVSAGATLSVATLNGSNFNPGVSHSVTAAVAVVVQATLNQYTITRSVAVGLSLVIRRTASPYGGAPTGILTGNTVYYGDELELTAQANSGYAIEYMAVNHVQYQDNPHIVTIVSSILVEVLSRALGFVHIDSGATTEKYKILIDSGSAIEQYRAMIDTGSEIVPY